jgi:hypothetical protein
MNVFKLKEKVVQPWVDGLLELEKVNPLIAKKMADYAEAGVPTGAAWTEETGWVLLTLGEVPQSVWQEKD